MISGLPESAILHQQLPKKAIYKKFGLAGRDKTKFNRSIHKMTIISDDFILYNKRKWLGIGPSKIYDIVISNPLLYEDK